MADPEQTLDPILNGSADGQPEVGTIAQYIKDLSAENPSAPQVFQFQSSPELDVQFNIAVNRVSEQVHEVVLRIELKAASNDGAHFLVDLSYAGLFGIRNAPDDALPPFLLVEAPRLLFPFARQIVAEAVQNLGFPPVLLDPIDFGAAYMAQVEASQGEPLADVQPVGNA